MNYMDKSTAFAKKIIRLASEEGLTINELVRAADMAKGISVNSTVESGCIEKTDFPSDHIVD